MFPSLRSHLKQNTFGRKGAAPSTKPSPVRRLTSQGNTVPEKSSPAAVMAPGHHGDGGCATTQAQGPSESALASSVSAPLPGETKSIQLDTAETKETILPDMSAESAAKDVINGGDRNDTVNEQAVVHSSSSEDGKNILGEQHSSKNGTISNNFDSTGLENKDCIDRDNYDEARATTENVQEAVGHHTEAHLTQNGSMSAEKPASCDGSHEGAPRGTVALEGSNEHCHDNLHASPAAVTNQTIAMLSEALLSAEYAPQPQQQPQHQQQQGAVTMVTVGMDTAVQPAMAPLADPVPQPQVRSEDDVDVLAKPKRLPPPPPTHMQNEPDHQPHEELTPQPAGQGLGVSSGAGANAETHPHDNSNNNGINTGSSNQHANPNHHANHNHHSNHHHHWAAAVSPRALANTAKNKLKRLSLGKPSRMPPPPPPAQTGSHDGRHGNTEPAATTPAGCA